MAKEHCPLGPGISWVHEGRLPEFCRVHCEALWEEASRGEPHIDVFDEACTHDVEYGDEAIQRREGNKRQFSILNTCIETGDDAFSENYEFVCPYE